MGGRYPSTLGPRKFRSPLPEETRARRTGALSEFIAQCHSSSTCHAIASEPKFLSVSVLWLELVASSRHSERARNAAMRETRITVGNSALGASCKAFIARIKGWE